MPITHTFVDLIPDNPEDAAAGRVLPSHWNANHTLALALTELPTIADGTVLGNTSGSPATPTEVPISSLAGVATVDNADGTLTVNTVDGDVDVSLNLDSDNDWTGTQNFPQPMGVGTTSPGEALGVESGGDRCAIETNYTGTAASVTAGVGWVGSFNGTEKVAFGWLAPTNTSTGLNTPSVSVFHSIADQLNIYTDAAKDIVFATDGVAVEDERLRILGADGTGSLKGNIGVGTSNPTARFHLPAGAASSGAAPLKFTSGSLMVTPAAGAVEFLSDKWYGTISTGPTRMEFVLSAGLTSGRIPYVTTNGRLADDGDFVWDGTTVRITANSANSLELATTDGSGYTQLTFFNNVSNIASLAVTGNAFGAAGLYVASQLSISAFAAGGLMLQTNTTSPVVIGTNSTKRIEMDAAGNVVVGQNLATNATDGFLYIPSCAGTPTGTPTAYANRNAMCWDRTNKKLYVYDGGWNVMN